MISVLMSKQHYESADWSPWQRTEVKSLEKINRRAARFVTSIYHRTSSVSNMIDQLRWQDLETRRQNFQLSLILTIYQYHSLELILTNSLLGHTLATSGIICQAISKKLLLLTLLKTWLATNCNDYVFVCNCVNPPPLCTVFACEVHTVI